MKITDLGEAKPPEECETPEDIRDAFRTYEKNHRDLAEECNLSADQQRCLRLIAGTYRQCAEYIDAWLHR